MKNLKGQLAYIDKKITTKIFNTPPADYWSDIFQANKYRDLEEVEQKFLNQPVFIVDNTNTECKVLFINGQTGWIWSTNCIIQKKN